MTTDDIIASVKEQAGKARTKLDEMRVNANLLKLDMRDRKDEVMEDLEQRYQLVQEKLRGVVQRSGAAMHTTKDALKDAWSAFKARLDETSAE